MTAPEVPQVSVFVSYAEEDAATAEAVAATLRDRGWLPVFMPPEKFKGAVGEAVFGRIRRSSVVVVVVSEAMAASKWVEKEVVYADEAGKPVIPFCSGAPGLVRQLHDDGRLRDGVAWMIVLSEVHELGHLPKRVEAEIRSDHRGPVRRLPAPMISRPDDWSSDALPGAVVLGIVKRDGRGSTLVVAQDDQVGMCPIGEDQVLPSMCEVGFPVESGALSAYGDYLVVSGADQLAVVVLGSLEVDFRCEAIASGAVFAPLRRQDFIHVLRDEALPDGRRRAVARRIGRYSWGAGALPWTAGLSVGSIRDGVQDQEGAAVVLHDGGLLTSGVLGRVGWDAETDDADPVLWWALDLAVIQPAAGAERRLAGIVQRGERWCLRVAQSDGVGGWVRAEWDLDGSCTDVLVERCPAGTWDTGGLVLRNEAGLRLWTWQALIERPVPRVTVVEA